MLLKKDFLSWVRVARAQVQAAEDTSPSASQHSPGPGVGHGEDWLVLAVFSHFKGSYSVLLWSFVCFVWFCFLLFFSSGGKAPPPSQWSCVLDIMH